MKTWYGTLASNKPAAQLYEYTVAAMLVHTLRLRKLGVRLIPAELRLQPPLVGHLTLRPSVYAGRDGRERSFCCVVQEVNGAGESLGPYSARLLKIESRGILIAGDGESWERRRCTTHKQTMWAWPAPGGNPKRPPPGATLGSMRFVDALAALVLRTE